MRPVIVPVLLLVSAAASGCVPVGYAGGGYGYVTTAPQEQVESDELTLYNDRPAVIYGGQPVYLYQDPSLGFGWRDPYQRWHSAPPDWRDRAYRGRQAEPQRFAPQQRYEQQRVAPQPQRYEPQRAAPQREFGGQPRPEQRQEPRPEPARAAPQRQAPQPQQPRGGQPDLDYGRRNQPVPPQDLRSPGRDS